MAETVFEFRGVDNFYFAEVLTDTDGASGAYSCDTPIHIPVQEIGKSVSASSDAHFYDNGPLIVIDAVGPDTLTLTLAPPSLATYAKMFGLSYDEATGMIVEGDRAARYFAIMYRTRGTDGGYRYVSRLKGKFAVPDETYHTEDSGTDANNIQVTFTGVRTVHQFNKGRFNGTSWEKGTCSSITVDGRLGLADVSSFFESVQTPDTIA